MDIKVLGACCKKSEQMFENTKLAVVNLGLNITVENIGDSVEIMNYGVMSTPALVIDGKVLSSGKLLTVSEIESAIKSGESSKTSTSSCSCGGRC